MKKLLVGLTLLISISSFAQVNCKLIQENIEGKYVDIKMTRSEGIQKIKFTKDFYRGKLTSYSVTVDKKTEDIRVKVKSAGNITLSLWASFDSTGDMLIGTREDNGSSAMINCEK